MKEKLMAFFMTDEEEKSIIIGFPDMKRAFQITIRVVEKRE